MNHAHSAHLLLEHRRRGGYSLLLYLRLTALRHLLSVGVFLTATALSVALGLIPLAWWLVGLYTGAVLRDIAWLLAMRRAWAFTELVTDWQKVADLAGSHGLRP